MPIARRLLALTIGDAARRGMFSIAEGRCEQLTILIM